MGPAEQNTEKSVRQLRIDIDTVTKSLSKLYPSRELSLVKTKLEEAKMWAGKELANTDAPELPEVYKDEGKGTV